MRTNGRGLSVSVRLMSSVFSMELLPTPRGPRPIKPTEKLILLAMADWANDDGGSLHPSMGAIARKACVSQCQARRIVRGFMRDGLLVVEANAAGGKPGTTPHYRLMVDKLTASTRATSSIDATPSSDARAGMGDRDGSHGREGRASTDARQTISYPSENHQRRARELGEICKANGVVHLRPHVLATWVREALQDDVLREAIAVARDRKPYPESIPVNYVAKIVADLLRGPKQREDRAWRKDPELARAKGESLGIKARAGEELYQYVSRIDEAQRVHRLRAVA